MTKTDLIDAIARATRLTKTEVAEVLDQLQAEIAGALYRGEEATLPGIGKLVVTVKATRMGRNPNTGETIEIPARKAPRFKFSKSLRELVARF